jgi:hypothetical protein
VIDGVAHRISVCLSPPDKRPAALILLDKEP